MSQLTKVNALKLEETLAHIGKKFDVAFESMNVDGCPLETLNINNMQKHLDKLLLTGAIHNPLRDLPLWAKVWPSSFVLGRFLRKFSPEGKTLLELGCGMGICSLIASRYGFSQIIATDIEDDALDFARANILRNNLQDIVDVRHLDIRSPKMELPFSQGFDRIAASEVLYLDELHRPLLKFLDKFLAPGGQAFFCTDLARLKPRFQKLASRSFKVQEGKIGIKSTDDNGQETRRIYSILILEK